MPGSRSRSRAPPARVDTTTRSTGTASRPRAGPCWCIGANSLQSGAGLPTLCHAVGATARH